MLDTRLVDTLSENLESLKEEYSMKWTTEISQQTEDEFRSQADDFYARMKELENQISEAETDRQANVQEAVFLERKLAVMKNLECYLSSPSNRAFPNPVSVERPKKKLSTKDIYFKVSLFLVLK